MKDADAIQRKHIYWACIRRGARQIGESCVEPSTAESASSWLLRPAVEAPRRRRSAAAGLARRIA